jgi:glycosyltransferase involved in cell wall biosynthesis
MRALPFSVHPPASPVAAQRELASRVQVLYAGSWVSRLTHALMCVLRSGPRVGTALNWLVDDMRSVGLGRREAWKLGYQWLMGARLGVALRQAGCVHLHVHFAHVPAQIAMYASAFTGIPFTIMAHANDIFERGLLLPRKAQRAVKMLTISEHNVAYLRSVGVPEARLAVVRCGVSFAVRSPVAILRRDRYRIGTLGRLVEKKGVDDLLRALARLRTQAWTWELSIAGDGPLRTSLEALAVELGIHEQVHFEGAMGHAAVGAWMQSLDVFALACKADVHGDMDGIPVVLMEAMSQRVPVVSTRLSGIPELVIHDRTGLLSPPADPASLAVQLQRLLDAGKGADLRSRLAEAAVQHVQAEFSQATNLDRLMQYFPAAAKAPQP